MPNFSELERGSPTSSRRLSPTSIDDTIPTPNGRRRPSLYAAGATGAASSTTSTPACEPAGLRAGRTGPAPSSSVEAAPAATASRSASSWPRPARARGEERRPAARRRSRPPRPARRAERRRGSGASRVRRAAARSSRASEVMSTLRAPSSAISSSAELEVLVVVELLADERLGLRLVRRDEERLGLDPEAQRLAFAVEHRRDVAAGELVDRLGVEVVARRRAAASRRRRRARRPARGSASFSRRISSSSGVTDRPPLVDLGVGVARSGRRRPSRCATRPRCGRSR